MRRRRLERGAVLVEVAIVLPMLMAISLGVFDIGLAWRTKMTLSNAVRTGVRVDTNMGVATNADQSALISLVTALTDVPSGDIERVVVFHATSATGTVPSACLTDVAKEVGGDSASQCNVYRASELTAIAANSGGQPTFNGNCTTSRDHFWCPSQRVNSQIASSGPDLLGIYIRLNHTTATKMFGTTMPISETSVMRLEPNAGSS